MPAAKQSRGRKTAAKSDADTTQVETVSGELVPAPGNENVEVHRAWEAALEAEVAAEMAGAVLETMAYSFTVSGKRVYGLGIHGANEAARIYALEGFGSIDCDSATFEDGFDHDGHAVIRCLAHAIDRKTGNGSVALAEQRVYPEYNGRKTFDPNARKIALSKAKRNVKLDLISAEIKARMLLAIERGQYKTVELTTPRQQAEAGAQRKQIDRQGQETAQRPKRQTRQTAPISDEQVRMLYGRAKTAGIPNDRDPRWRAVLQYLAGVTQVDRVQRKDFDAIKGAFEDLDGTLAEITDRAAEKDAAAEAAAAILQAGGAPAAGQTTLDTGQGS